MFRLFDKRVLSALSDEGGAGAPPAEGIVEGGAQANAPAEPSIYGDLQVKFPEGLDPDIQEAPSLKSFVDKETGEINYSNLMKSYVHAKKQMGADKVILPSEHATDIELNEFYSKLGYEPEFDKYAIERDEKSNLSEELTESVRKFAHENRVPLKTAQEMVKMLDEQAGSHITRAEEAQVKEIETGLNSLKDEWGQAYEPKLGVAQRVLKEVIKDEELIEVFADPRIGSNPGVIKALAKIGEGLFKEDGFAGQSQQPGVVSPNEASEQINEIMGNREHPYFNKSHPGHKDAVAKMSRLFEMKRGR